MTRIPEIIRNVAHKAGYDIRRYRPLVNNASLVQQRLLSSIACKTVFDVGAFRGDKAAEYAELFPSACIHAFEPFPASFENLAARFSNHSRIKLVNAAVSSQSGVAKFHVNGLPETNSLLARPAEGRRYFHERGITERTVEVPTVSLDSYRVEHQVDVPQIIKLDIQGNELNGLRGADDTLATGEVAIIYTEVNFVPHYEGSILFHELTAHLATRGYSLLNLYDSHSDPQTGQLRFGDALFISQSLRSSAIDAGCIR